MGNTPFLNVASCVSGFFFFFFFNVKFGEMKRKLGHHWLFTFRPSLYKLFFPVETMGPAWLEQRVNR